MNYPLGFAALSFAAGAHRDQAAIDQHGDVRGGVRHEDGPGFLRRVQHQLSTYDPAITAVQLNLLGSHDMPRIRTICAGDTDAVRMAILVQMTLPGAPCIYYGDEIGLTGDHDPDCRGSFPEDAAAWDQALHDYVRGVVALRHAHPALRGGTFSVAGAGGMAAAYVRRDEAEALVVCLNAGEQPERLEVQVPGLDGRTLEPVTPPRVGVARGGSGDRRRRSRRRPTPGTRRPNPPRRVGRRRPRAGQNPPPRSASPRILGSVADLHDRSRHRISPTASGAPSMSRARSRARSRRSARWPAGTSSCWTCGDAPYLSFIQGAGAEPLVVDPASPLAIPVEDASQDVVVTLWTGFRGVLPADLAEVDRVLRPGGRLLVVHDYGRDDVSTMRDPDAPEYRTWSRREGPFLRDCGFRIRVVHCFWTFASLEEARDILVELFGERGAAVADRLKRPRLSWNVAIYHRWRAAWRRRRDRQAIARRPTAGFAPGSRRSPHVPGYDPASGRAGRPDSRSGGPHIGPFAITPLRVFARDRPGRRSRVPAVLRARPRPAPGPDHGDRVRDLRDRVRGDRRARR